MRDLYQNQLHRKELEQLTDLQCNNEMKKIKNIDSVRIFWGKITHRRVIIRTEWEPFCNVMPTLLFYPAYELLVY